MDIMQVIKERRAIRKFRSDPVPDEALNTVLEAARWAPSWGNTQCWRLVVVRDQETRARLVGTLTSARPEGRNSATDAVRDAPVLIVVCAVSKLSGYYRAGEKKGMPASDTGDWFMFDLGLAMQNFTLAAHALGLGTVHVGMFKKEEVAAILNIPDSLVIVELMPLGWPDEKPPIRPRLELSEFVFYDRYTG